MRHGGLDQPHGGNKIAGKLPGTFLHRDLLPLLPVLHRGIEHQRIHRAHFRRQAVDLLQPAQVGAQPAGRPDLFGRLLRLFRLPGTMHQHRVAIPRQLQRHRPADPARGTGHQHAFSV